MKMRYLYGFIAALAMTVLCSFAACADEIPGEPRFADYENMLVHYKDLGEGEPVLVFVHGWTCNLNFWRSQVEEFSGSHRVLLVDLPGHGDSGKPRLDYTIPFFAGAVLAVMDDAEVDQAVLVGHSMGFPVAREAWRRASDRVSALIGVDGAMNRTPEDPKERAEWGERNRIFLQRFEGPAYEEHVRRFVGGMHCEQTPPEVREEVIEEMLETPAYVGRSAMKHFTDPHVWENYAVDAPVLMIYADMPWVRDGFEDMVRALFPRMTFRKVSGVGHFMMLEEPAKVNRIIREFLEDI
jgi:pimeloyl-ACP methyl ester carboxylesterase